MERAFVQLAKKANIPEQLMPELIGRIMSFYKLIDFDYSFSVPEGCDAMLLSAELDKLKATLNMCGESLCIERFNREVEIITTYLL